MKCIGVKIVEAVEMNAVDASIMRYNVNAHIGDGYEVTYGDGYKSWTPKDVFDKAYRQIDNLTFGLAIEALKLGKRVARQGWNGKGMFIFMRPADELNIEFVVNKIKSLPQSVKDFYKQDIIDENGNQLPINDDDIVKFTSYLCMKAADGSIVNGWLASQTDILSEDWVILD
jgi:hypothetical protein